jgi:hypothetical protein
MDGEERVGQEIIELERVADDDRGDLTSRDA